MSTLQYKCNECGSLNIELPFLIYLPANEDDWEHSAIVDALDCGEQKTGCYCRQCGDKRDVSRADPE